MKQPKVKVERKVRFEFPERLEESHAGLMRVWAAFSQAATQQGWTESELNKLQRKLNFASAEEFCVCLFRHVIQKRRVMRSRKHPIQYEGVIVDTYIF